MEKEIILIDNAQKRLEEIRKQHLQNTLLATQQVNDNKNPLALQSDSLTKEKLQTIKQCLNDKVPLNNNDLHLKLGNYHPILLCAILGEVELMTDILKRGIEVFQYY